MGDVFGEELFFYKSVGNSKCKKDLIRTESNFIIHSKEYGKKYKINLDCKLIAFKEFDIIVKDNMCGGRRGCLEQKRKRLIYFFMKVI